jgi:hypothetical protein
LFARRRAGSLIPNAGTARGAARAREDMVQDVERSAIGRATDHAIKGASR